MPYNNLVTRTKVSPLVPEQVSNEMLGKATEESAVLGLFRRIPVGSGQLRFPVLSALPMAYWVSGDTGLKQTTELAWANKYMTVEEIATILPVPDNVIADVEADIWDEAMPLLVEAFGRVLDSAVFFGANAPGSFPTNVVAAASAAGNVVTEGTATAAAGGFFGDMDSLLARVEEDGYEITGFLGPISLRSRLRTVRDTTGQRLDAGRVGPDLGSFDGVPVRYPMRGLWPQATPDPDGAGPGLATNGIRVLGGEWNQFVVGVRQDIDLKVLTEAVITDNTGAIIFNLPQQDMTAVRLTFRVGWQVVNTINNDRPVEAQRYPAGLIQVVPA
jgi:HK97 family phage major capsid protein